MYDQQEYVIKSLRALGHANWIKVAKRTKVSVHNISKLAYGKVTCPRYDTLKPLVSYFVRYPQPGVRARAL